MARPFYGWTIVALSAWVNALAWSTRVTFALFYVALLDEFGWRRGEAALGYSLSWLLLLVFGPLAGRLTDRWGPRVVVPMGGLLLGAALALTGQVQTLWQYYLSFGVLGAAGMACIMMPAAAVVSRWFTQSRGTAMGIVSAGASSSAVLFYPLTVWLITALGWRNALAVYGCVVAVGIGPLAACLYRRQPTEMSAAPDGRLMPCDNALVAQSPHPQQMAVFQDWTLAQSLRTVSLWAVFVMWGLGVIGYQILSTHQVAHGLGRGFDPALLAWVFGLAGAFTTVGNLLGGVLSDRWGRGWVFSLGTLIAVIGIGFFSAVTGPHDLVKLVIYAVAAGMGFGMRISMLAAIPADLFQGKHFGAILGFVNGGGGVGGFIGPILAGYLFDVTGGYHLAFAVGALTVTGSAVAAWIAGPRKVRIAQASKVL
jgi:MFS family permease